MFRPPSVLPGIREEQLADLGQPLEGVVAAVVGAVAVGPLVVADGVDQRIGEPGELPGDVLEDVVGAEIAARLDVADVHHEPDLGIGVDRIHERRQLRAGHVAVGHVTDDGDVERGGGLVDGGRARVGGWGGRGIVAGAGREGQDAEGQQSSHGAVSGVRAEQFCRASVSIRSTPDPTPVTKSPVRCRRVDSPVLATRLRT